MIAIIGGGIAGLWILASLRARGYDAILVEQDALGAGQTLASQGIIHGGTKYALTGRLSGAAQAIAAMPARWEAARQGQGDVDLSDARLFSTHQYLWTIDEIGGKLTTFFASKLMHSRMNRLKSQQFPDFLPRNFQGGCYALEEPVFDVHSVISTLARRYQPFIFTETSWHLANGEMVLNTAQGEYAFAVEKVIYTAGKGNQAISGETQQLRPLHMMALRVPHDARDIYGHCLGMSDKPKITITTHPYDWQQSQGDKVYWIGGQPAETGVARDHDAQIAAVRALLKETLPWLDDAYLVDDAKFISVHVDRAEGANAGKRPDLPVIIAKANAITVWPTKLAFAPWVADKVLSLLPPAKAATEIRLPEHEVKIASYPWQR